MSLPKIIAIIGPTASGKTELGVKLAQAFNGEIVSCDAKQVYVGMDIGTAKEKNLPVPQHLIDIKQPGERVTVAEYQILAYQKIDDILSRAKLPIMVGGSMLYAESVINGYEFSDAGKSGRQVPRYEVLKIGIDIPRAILKLKIKNRVEDWAENGLIEEIQTLLDKGVSPAWLDHCGLEYKYFTEYIHGKKNLEEAKEKTTTANNQYVKRQYTWWRRHEDVHWVKDRDEAEALLREWL